MKIVSSILPSESIQTEMKRLFPEAEFQFYKGMKRAEEDFYNAEVFITYGEDLSESHIKKANNLKWIMVMSAGLDKMPIAACKEKGILITNARGVHKIPMAEYALGVMLQYAKNMRTLWENEKEHIWDRRITMGELSEKNLLVVGVGAIGGEIARLGKAFNMHTLGVNRSGTAVDYVDELYTMNELDKVMERADYVVSVLPSTSDTKNFYKYQHFLAMKNTAVFINLGRGDVVDEKVLMKALKEEQIAHAILDVFPQEPLEKGHFFWEMENVTVTPHISSITAKYLPRSFEIFKHNLHIYINKEQNYLNKIELERGY